MSVTGYRRCDLISDETFGDSDLVDTIAAARAVLCNRGLGRATAGLGPTRSGFLVIGRDEFATNWTVPNRNVLGPILVGLALDPAPTSRQNRCNCNDPDPHLLYPAYKLTHRHHFFRGGLS